MKKILVLVPVLLFLLSEPVLADTVTQFSFITPPQSIGINTPSDTITIQSQNSGSISENITETTDIVFTSTSKTGQFLSTSGNPVSTVMSKNTANKNFLYKDPTAGTFTLTITATGRTSLQTFTASQEITVSGSGNTSTNTSTTTSTGNNTTTLEESPTITISGSAHSSPSPLSDLENKLEFEVSAGRNRLTTVGSQVVFRALPTKLQNISEQAISYEWSFGDGTTGRGSSINHIYNFPGEYSVVLNASAFDKQAVSRATAKVINPSVTLGIVSGGVEISNKSSFEINLEGWILSSNVSNNKSTFIFPKDTLIPSGKKVIFGNNITGITSGDIDLNNPTGKTFASISTQSSSTTPTSDFSIIQDKITELQTKVAKISATSKKTAKTEIIVPKPTQVTEVNTKVNLVEDSKINSQNATNTAVVFEAVKKPGILSSVFSWPRKGFNFIEHLFVEN